MIRLFAPRGGTMALLALIASSIVACAGQPFEYRSSREIPEGPGMFTGAAGAVVLTIGEKEAAAKASAPARTQEADTLTH
jgi:hypothetical protein